ncbi:MAG: hypothetical protein R2746_10665 [Acidimicrobiales bacterium]
MPLRLGPAPPRHPAVREAVPGGQAQARRAGVGPVPAEQVQGALDAMHDGGLNRAVLDFV